MTLDYLNYHKIAQTDRELLRSDIWDFQFIVPPVAVYWPGDELIKVRLAQVSNTEWDGTITTISENVRGFEVMNIADTANRIGDVTLEVVDREDQSLVNFALDYREKAGSLLTRMGVRTEFLTFVCKLTQYNTSRIPIRSTIYLDCKFTNLTIPGAGASEPSSISRFTWTFHYSMYTPQLLNK